MTLTKADLVQQIYQNHEGVTKTQAMEAVEAFLRISKDTLTGGSDLLLSGFGKFNVKKKSPRKGRNPQTCPSQKLIRGKYVAIHHPRFDD